MLWRDVGGAVTIQCRCPEPGQEYLHVKKGLSRDFQVLFKENNSDENTIAKDFTGRLQVNGKFPNLDILIKNLTSEDTGPYWCVYQKYDKTSYRKSDTEGKGSVLLVVRGETHQFIHFATKPMKSINQPMIMWEFSSKCQFNNDLSNKFVKFSNAF